MLAIGMINTLVSYTLIPPPNLIGGSFAENTLRLVSMESKQEGESGLVNESEI